MLRPAYSLLALLLLAPPAPAAPEATVAAEPHGQVARLPAEPGPHWLWVGDRVLRHSTLFDGDAGRALGMVDVAWSLGGETPYYSRKRNELYVVEPVWEFGVRGKRRDFVTVYDASTLTATAHIEFPTHSAMIGHGQHVAALLDDERFLVVFNHEPAQSVTVVDVARRRYAGEIATAGCALVYPVSARSFAMLCGNGTALEVTLDDAGTSAVLAHSDKFFDAVDDPVSDKAARDGDRWLFVTFDGVLHPVDFSGPRPRIGETWPLIEGAEDADPGAERWRVGGTQHVAYHRGSGRLYVLVHEGGPGSHKDAGSEIRVYDVAGRRELAPIAVPNLLPAFIRPYAGIEKDSFADRVLGWALPNPGVHSLVVSEDSRPLLFVRHDELGAIGVLDAMSGRHLHDIEETGIGGGGMSVP